MSLRIPGEAEGSAAHAPTAGPQFVASISGFEDVAYAVAHFPKPANYDQDLQAICQLKRNAIRAAIERYENQLSSANFNDVLTARHALGQLWSYQGDMTKTILHL